MAAYGVLRVWTVTDATLLGPGSVMGAVRFTAVLGLPLALLGMLTVAIAFVRREPRLWLAVGAFGVCALILIVSYLELSGKLVGILAETLPGIPESTGGSPPA